MWDNYFPLSWHTIHYDKEYYIFANYTDIHKNKRVFHISEATNQSSQGAIGSDFNTFKEAEDFLVEYLISLSNSNGC
ncbi:hypothetical protein A1D23_13005 [Chelonobacter oris]|nr:hypothetical protein [Chelonobacter oris]